MTDAAAPMHKDFAKWYSVVGLGDGHERRQARWSGLTEIVRQASSQMVEALLRLAHRSRQPPPAASVNAIRQVFKDADDEFDMSGNDRELQVLAGACLAVLMNSGSRAAKFAALAATTAGLGGARKPELPMDLAALGEAAILHWGNVNRKRPALNVQTKGGMPVFDFEQAAAKVRELQNFEGVAEAFTLAANSARTAMQQVEKRQAKAMDDVAHFLRVQDEELQMLWWLTGQRSFDFDCAFEAVPTDSQPLVFASELAQCTQFLPGPPSVKGMLSRAGLKDRKKALIMQTVNATDSEWLRTLLGETTPSTLLMPIHAAIMRQLETGAGDTWVAGWAASTEVNADIALSGLALSNFFYRERLLLILG